METPDKIDLSELLSPITLPCGRTLSNRLVKAPTYEHLSSYFGGPPNDAFKSLYERYAEGGWGMIVSGNVQVSAQHLSLGADLLVPERLTESSIEPFRILACAMKSCKSNSNSECYSPNKSLAIMQLSHAGRQSPNFLGGRWPFQSPLSASVTRVNTSKASMGKKSNIFSRLVDLLLFQTATEMSEKDIEEVTEGFVRGAELAAKCGLDGIEIHAAHGYLVAQFISRKTNLRQSTDKYSAPLAFLHKIISSVRSAPGVPKDFVVGIKFNVSDYTRDGIGEEQGMKHLAEITSWYLVDYIQISGGDYETPDFMKASTSTRQVFFESFSRIAVKAVSSSNDRLNQESLETNSKNPNRLENISPPLIMLTGGFRTRHQFARALAQKHAHLIGIARLAILEPDLPRLLERYQNEDQDNSEETGDSIWKWETQPLPHIHSPSWWPKVVGGGIAVAWYTVAMRRTALNRRLPSESTGWLPITLEMYLGMNLDVIIFIKFITVALLFALFANYLLVNKSV